MQISKSETFSDHVITLVHERFCSRSSPAWEKWGVTNLQQLNGKHREAILSKGQIDFTKSRTVQFDNTAITFTPDDLALLHTYYYAEMHHYCLRRCIHLIWSKLLPILNSKPLVIDFGCGASTAGLTLADLYAQHTNSNPLCIDYRGIDLSQSMLDLGNYLMTAAPFIHRNSTLQFSTDYKQVSVARAKQPVVLLFSFVMAHEINISELAGWIVNELMPVCSSLHIINQNSIKRGKNANWNKLVSTIKDSASKLYTYDALKNYSFTTDPRTGWKNGNKVFTFDVIFSYICYVNSDNNDTSSAV
ncbi:MAG: hypothetical protein ACRC3B_05260 [Bacteroidia bacterium]